VGTRFRLRWDPSRGGEVSLSRVSPRPGAGDGDGSAASRAMWETVPGVAFLSVASAATEADECRGSFALRDHRARLVPDRQHVDRIKASYRCDAAEAGPGGADLLRAAAFEPSDATRFPVLVMTGLVSANKTGASPSCTCCRLRAAGRRARSAAGRPVLLARYWIVLEEKSDTQVAFSVKIGDYQWTCAHADPAKSTPATATTTTAPRLHRPSLRLRLSGRVQRGTSKKTRLAPTTPSREEVSAALLPGTERVEELRPEEFNRVFLTYASSRDERFFGFGEQFCRVEFKGKRVRVLVQEQGIGRGDNPSLLPPTSSVTGVILFFFPRLVTAACRTKLWKIQLEPFASY